MPLTKGVRGHRTHFEGLGGTCPQPPPPGSAPGPNQGPDPQRPKRSTPHPSRRVGPISVTIRQYSIGLILATDYEIIVP